MSLIKLNNLIEGEVIKRPSKRIKTPYVADILLEDTKEEVLGHSASLGCCGLVDVGAKILMTISNQSKTTPKNKEKLKCTHTVYLSILQDKGQEQVIGVHPKLAENLTEEALKTNCFTKLQNVKKYDRETTIIIEDKVSSRFDFTGMDNNNIPFIMEVKNVPLADYEDVTAKERKKMDFSDREFNTKVAYFPDGYRKKCTDTVSPRALKHIRELTFIKKNSEIRCIMCYVIQRTDVNRFQPSIIDPEYREAFKEAVAAGVEIITMVVHWNRNGEANFVRDDLPITEII